VRGVRRYAVTSTRSHPNAEAALLLLLDETSHHQLHQRCEITLRNAVTGELSSAFNQVAQFGVSREVHAKTIG